MRIDIACNITSEQFKDSHDVIQRSKDNSTLPIFVGVDFKSSLQCIELANKYNTLCYAGLHPTHSEEYPEDVEKLSQLIGDEAVVAIGECGLDYCRTEFASISHQKKAFVSQLDLRGERYFLHSRECHRDFMEIISDYSFSGVVHSFTGTPEEAKELIKKGLFIGINGCSLKTEEGVEMVKSLPLESILFETDSPYCKIRKSYAGFKYLSPRKELKILKKRNEPCCLDQISEVVSKIKECDVEIQIFKNTLEFLGPKVHSILPLWE